MSGRRINIEVELIESKADLAALPVDSVISDFYGGHFYTKMDDSENCWVDWDYRTLKEDGSAYDQESIPANTVWEILTCEGHSCFSPRCTSNPPYYVLRYPERPVSMIRRFGETA